jgi:hypothetical protein
MAFPAFNLPGHKNCKHEPPRHHGRGHHHKDDPCKRQTKNKRHECHPKPRCHR